MYIKATALVCVLGHGDGGDQPSSPQQQEEEQQLLRWMALLA